MQNMFHFKISRSKEEKKEMGKEGREDTREENIQRSNHD